ncbi:MAG: type II toxin-antitoxin system RelE/ParE family toxin [Coriobacteriia bacterium]|nr:type II toxin-antitoxin system RelE/ParE family toxin [Coriobacteriia bacterium]
MVDRVCVKFSQSAYDDLRGILDWYSSKQLPMVGVRLVAEILARVDQLTTSPESGRVVPEFEVPSLRELKYPPFLIVYRHAEGAVTIVRVW